MTFAVRPIAPPVSDTMEECRRISFDFMNPWTQPTHVLPMRSRICVESHEKCPRINAKQSWTIFSTPACGNADPFYPSTTAASAYSSARRGASGKNGEFSATNVVSAEKEKRTCPRSGHVHGTRRKNTRLFFSTGPTFNFKAWQPIWFAVSEKRFPC